MRFLHISDLHIGKQLYGYSLREDQEYILKQIVRIAAKHRPDGILIAGDVFDRSVPAGESYTILDGFLADLREAVPEALIFMIAGNHDSPERLSYASGFLRRHHIYISTMPPQEPDQQLLRVEMEDAWGTVTVWLMPFVRPGYVKAELRSTQEAFAYVLERQHPDPKQRNVLVAHQLFVYNSQLPQRSDSEQVSLQIGGLDQVDARLLEPFDYCALGHIHRPQSAGEARYRYCGTPLQYSAGEAGQEKSVTLVTLEQKGSPVQIDTVVLQPLRRVRRLEGTLAELLKGPASDDYVSLMLTDEGELFQPKEQLEEVYSHILELRLQRSYLPQEQEAQRQEEALSVQELFEAFYRDIWHCEMSDAEHAYLEEVLSDETAAD